MKKNKINVILHMRSLKMAVFKVECGGHDSFTSVTNPYWISRETSLELIELFLPCDIEKGGCNSDLIVSSTS
jgi:hypothetical protein